MSLMNDALRKKKNEKKHPSGTDFLKNEPEGKAKNRVRIYGIATIALLVCAMAGYYVYEMMSLSRPMTPVQSPPPAEKPRMNPTGEPVASDRTGDVPASSETAVSMPPQTEKQAVPSETATTEPTSPLPKPEVRKAATVAAHRETAEQPLSPSPRESISRDRTVPPPVIEPEEVGPRPEPAGKPSRHQPEKAAAATAADTGTEPVEELFYRKGLSYHRQHKLESAVRMYQAVLKINPDHRPTRFNLASAYIQLSAFTKARAILVELNRQEPENPEILSNLAVVEIGLDRPEEALAFLENAEKGLTAPTFEILFHKGIAYSRMGNFEAALAMYRKAERLAPENPRLHLNMAIVYDSLGRYDRALDRYRIFLEMNASLTATERREIETRVRELKVYLAQKTSRSSTNPAEASGQ